MTMLPVAPKAIATGKDWKEVIKYFPWVGFIFAAANTALILVFRQVPGLSSKPLLFAFAITFINLIISGGLHLDGLADSADGLAANKPSHTETREVMRDSRVGAFGAIAIAIVLIAKICFLAEADLLSNFSKLIAMLILVPIITRSSVVIVMSKQARDNSEHISKVSDLMSDFDKKSALRHSYIAAISGLIITSLIETFIGHENSTDSIFDLGFFALMLLTLTYLVHL